MIDRFSVAFTVVRRTHMRISAADQHIPAAAANCSGRYHQDGDA